MVALTKKKCLPSELFFLKIGPNLVDGIRRNHCGMAVLTSTEYKYLLDTELGALMFPAQLSECQDTHCKREDHLEAVDWFAVEMMEAVQTA